MLNEILIAFAVTFFVRIISTTTGGISEVITNNETGLLVPPNSPDKIKSAIELLINNPELRTKLMLNAQSHAENYAWEKVAYQFIDLYKKCLD